MGHYSKKTKAMLSLLLCAALLWAGPAWPMRTYAVVEEVDDGYDDDGYDDDEPEDEPDDNASSTASTRSSGSNAEADKINNQINEVTETLKSIQEQQKKIEQSIQGARTEKEKAEAERNSVGTQISLKNQELAQLQQRIAALEEQIAMLEQDIEDRQAEIAQKQQEIDDYYELFKKRLRAKYMQDNGTMLGLVLGADSFSDFLTRTEYMNRVAEHDRNLMEVLTVERVAIEEAKAKLESDVAQVEDSKALEEGDKADLEVVKQQLNVELAQAEAEVQNIAQMEKEYLANLEKNKAEQDRMKAEMDELYRQLKYIDSPYVGGEMLYPLPGFFQVSSGYGSRFGGSDLHTGIDLTGSGCRGANIVAANDGTVAKVNWQYVDGIGYGIYVILDHGVSDGQNITTLYAHCSNITVSEGQQVKKGDVIANVGSTGWSTGPHLHFEVRKGGSHVNPGPYIGI